MMATAERKKTEVVAKSTDPFMHFAFDCRWTLPILGVAPARPTLPDHLAKTIEDEEARILRETRRQRPSEVIPQEERPDDGVETPHEPLISERERWLKEALRDPALDDDAKDVIMEAFRVLSPGEKADRAVMRATNTFYRDPQSGNFAVPAKWFRGGMKAALLNDLNMYPDRAQRTMKGCVTILPPYLDLGTNEPDDVVNANVPLPAMPGREAQATIKRFHLVDPSKHGVEKFRVIIRVLDAPFAQEVAVNIHRLFIVVGASGVGGDRPNYGTFNVTNCSPFKSAKDEVSQEIVKELLRQKFVV